jgi:hypothetical protein
MTFTSDGAVGDPGTSGGGGKEAPRESIIREKKTDETWKEKAQKEKRKLADDAEAGGHYDLPAPSFLGIVEELSVRALLALGQLSNPATEEVYFDLESAKYMIDLLGILEEKTKGNLTVSEKAALEQVLHGLRLTFVQAGRNAPAMEGTPEDLAGQAILGSGDSNARLFGRGGQGGAGAPRANPPRPEGGSAGSGPKGPGQEKAGPKIIL